MLSTVNVMKFNEQQQNEDWNRILCFATRPHHSENGRYVPLPEDSPCLTEDPQEDVEDTQEKERKREEKLQKRRERMMERLEEVKEHLWKIKDDKGLRKSLKTSSIRLMKDLKRTSV